MAGIKATTLVAFALLSATASICFGQSGGWIPIPEGRHFGADVYFMPNPAGSNEASFLTNVPRDSQSISSDVEVIKADCVERTTTSLQSIYYSKNFAQGEVIGAMTAFPVHHPVPGSLQEVKLRLICGY